MDWEEKNEEWLEKFDDTGNYDSCVFLVGPDGGRQWQISVSMAKFGYYSDKICAILNSGFPLPQPIQLKNIEPRIFEILVQYVETGRVDEVDVNCLEVAKVCVAAEFLLIQCHKIWSTDYLTRNIRVENFWPVLETLLNVELEDMASALVEVLREKANECVEQPEFLTLHPKTVEFFLVHPYLKFSSELKLFERCRLWAQNQKDARAAMRDSCLPHMRLFTLSKEELSLLPKDMLEHTELAALDSYIVKQSDVKQPDVKQPDVASLKFCLKLEKRPVGSLLSLFTEFAIDVIPWRCSVPETFHESDQVVTVREGIVNTLVLTAKETILITSCSVITKMDKHVNILNAKYGKSDDEKWMKNRFKLEGGSDPENLTEFEQSQVLPMDSECSLREIFKWPFVCMQGRKFFLRVTNQQSSVAEEISTRKNTIAEANDFLLRSDHFEAFESLEFESTDCASDPPIFLKSFSFCFPYREKAIQLVPQ